MLASRMLASALCERTKSDKENKIETMSCPQQPKRSLG
jgi:hypothetical protein